MTTLLRRLRFNTRGNIALITAVVIIPLTFALGMAFDFTQSQSRKDQLDGAADVAALGAVTPTEMAVTPAVAQAQALALFNGQAATVAGVSSPVATVTVTDTSTGATVTRTVTVSYTAQSSDVFGSLLGLSTLAITGTSTSTSSTAPNINFYLLLDTSPSMEIAATSAGISAMEAATQQESDIGTPPAGNGCAFGCHQSNPSDLGNFQAYNTTTNTWGPIGCTANGAYSNGTPFVAHAVGGAYTASNSFPETGRDNFDLSRCINVTLRIDLLNAAVQNLMTTAGTTETTDHASYQVALYETNTNQASSSNDLNLYTLQPMTSNFSLAKTQAATISAMEMYQNNQLVSGDSNNDMDTYLDAALTSMNTTMPAPGGGTNNPSDTPQGVLFIVTDAMNDMLPSRQYTPMDWNGTICAGIRARGIRIAVLYTTYEPLNESWYLTQVVPAMPKTAPPKWPAGQAVSSDPMAMAAQQCASPGLYYQVSTDGDISAALQTLFQEAVATARLSH